MNNLSWMIYLAEIIGNVQGLFTAIAIIGSILIVAMAFVFALMEADDVAQSGLWKKPLKFIPIVTISAMIAVAAPSSRAIYMIAASEAGETVVTSPEAREMLGDLKEVIRRKLKEELKDEVDI